jgi:4-oxalmesaconate hydratase
VDALGLADADRAKVYERNARRVYPRLDSALRARGR